MRLRVLAYTLCVFLAMAPHSSKAQFAPATAGGSPADLEQSTFGELLQPEKLPADGIRGVRRLMLIIITALYNNSSQHRQVLRLCKVQAATAAEEIERKDARRCELSALLSLGRYAEAEELSATMGESLVPDPKVSPLEAVRRWRVVAAIAANRGEISLQQAALRRVIETIDRARAEPEVPSVNIANPELTASSNALQYSALLDAELAALWSLARDAYHRQQADSYAGLLNKLIAKAASQPNYGGSAAGVLAINSVVALVDLGMREQAVALARTYLPMIRADAGFRDVLEPIERFVPHPSAVATLGDERTQSGFAKSWVRLALAYALLGRDAEADRLLQAALSLSKRYVLEPEAGSQLIASVEQASAQVFLWRMRPELALPLLRSARHRLLNASVGERSTIFGRRQPETDGQLVDVGARLLSCITAVQPMPITDSALAAEVLEIASEFSASRAEGSALQAARAVSAPSLELRQLLVQEGELVDELIDLRGALSSAVVAGRQTDVDAAEGKTSAVLDALRGIKAKLELATVGSVGILQAAASSLPRLRLGQMLRQWIFHPAANLSLRIQDGAIRLVRLEYGLSTIATRAEAVHRAASLRDVSRMSELQQFPVQTSRWLFRVLFPDAELPTATGKEQHWILVPPPVLDRLPWAALVTSGADVSSARPRFLIESAALSVMPSVAAFKALSQRQPSKAQLDLLAVGDPTPASVSIDTRDLSRRGAIFASLDPSMLAVRADKPTAFAREIAAISALYGQARRTVLKNKAATKSALLRLPLSAYRVILFSTHGHMAGAINRSIGPSLELSGMRIDQRFLAADEISRLSLDADLVVLSACDTSASDGQLDAEGFSGLTSAFLLAGARNVVASLWPVETESAMRLTTRMMRNIRQGQSRAVAWAVRDAMLGEIESPVSGTWHPGFWAAFVVIGQ